MSKEAMIENILAQARASAANIVGDAEADRDELLGRARREAAEKLTAAKAEADENARLNLARKAKIAELDAKKLILAARRQLMARAYSAAAERLTGLSADKYRAFVGRLIEKYAEKGDTAVVAAADKTRLDDKWAAALSKKLGFDLPIEATGKFMGGVILKNPTCDKNLTVEMLIDEARPVTEAAVAALTEG